MRDPVKLELEKAAEEAAAIPGQAFVEKRLGRDTLPVTMWNKLDATPYGHFNKMMAAVRTPQPTLVLARPTTP